MFSIIAAAIWAAIRLQGHALFGPAVVVAIAAFISFGIMSNYRNDPMTVDAAVQRMVGLVSMLATLATIGLLIASFVVA